MHFALIYFRPDGKSIACVNEFRRDAYSIAVAPNATLKHMLDVKPARDFAELGLFVLEPKRRSPRGNTQAVHFGEGSEKFFCDALAEIGVVFCRTQIVERQDGDRFLR